MRRPNIYQIHGTNYTTREYCQSKGITDDYAIKKIQWRINTYIRNHPVRDTTEELIRLVSFSTVTSTAAKEIDSKDQIYELTPSGRRFNQKWLNEAGILPNAEDIQKANKPPKIEETNITNAPDRLRAAYRSLKLYAAAIEEKKTIQYKIDTLEAELKDAQKEVEKWSTNAAALLQDV